MIEELKWDSKFFGRRMGLLRMPNNDLSQLNAALDLARKQGYEYLLYKQQDASLGGIQQLESVGFRLVDIGVTWQRRLARGDVRVTDEGKMNMASVATEKDIPLLVANMANLFGNSRFYNDPMISRVDADRMHVEWIENSVRGKAADRVFHVPGKGFITCKLAAGGYGEIPLIGVKADCQGIGLGRTLMGVAMSWFVSCGMHSMRVRTQLGNTGAMNFYRKLGLAIDGHDLAMVLVL